MNPWSLAQELAFIERLGHHSHRSPTDTRERRARIRDLLGGYLAGLEQRDPRKTPFPIDAARKAASHRLRVV